MKIKEFKIYWIIIFLLAVSCSNNKGGLSEFDIVIERAKEALNKQDTGNNERRVQDLVIKASNYEQQMRNPEAILELLEAYRYDSSAAICFAMAKNYRAIEKYEPALRYCLSAIANDSLFVPAYELLAEIFFGRNEITNAVTVYHKLIELEPSLERKIALARFYELYDIPKAIKIYENANPGFADSEILFRLSRLYKQMDDKENYFRTIEKIYSGNPLNAQTAAAMLFAYAEDKDYEGVFSLLDDLDNKMPSSELHDLYIITATTLFTDSTQESTNYIKPFIARIDNRFRLNWKLQIMCGYLCDRINDEPQSVKFFDFALSLSDTTADIPLQIGTYFSLKKKNEKAVEFLKKYEKIYPSDSRFPFFIGGSLLALDSSRAALDYLWKAVRLDTGNLEAYCQIGFVYDKLAIHDSSDSAYEIVIAREPNHALANNNYAYSLAERGEKLEKALRMAEIALEESPSNPSYLDTYGWVQYKLGNLNGSLENIIKAISLGDASSEIFEHLGDIYLRMGKNHDASKAYRQSLDKEPSRRTVIDKLKNIKD
ncbi:MAG: Tetratricopeptide repeat protein [Ignavibacteria bacterium]|nr:Tetratricopeptide repeat protein [Ignavibacteria bacterium]